MKEEDFGPETAPFHDVRDTGVALTLGKLALQPFMRLERRNSSSFIQITRRRAPQE